MNKDRVSHTYLKCKLARTLFYTVLGVMVSLLSLSFHYLIAERANMSGDRYMAIYPAKSTYVSYDESVLYWPKVTSILMGDGVADPYLSEYKHVTTHIPFASEYIVALLLENANVSTNIGALLTDILFVGVLFLVLYRILSHSIGASPLISMLLALLFIFSFDLVLRLSLLPTISGVIHYFSDGNISILSRTTNMSVSILPLVLFSFFYFMVFADRGGKSKVNMLFASSAVLVYFNIYMWTFSFAMIATTYLARAFYKKSKVGMISLLVELKAPILIYLIILVPFLLVSIDSYSQVGYQEYLDRFGVAHTRSMHILTVGYVPLLAALHFLYKKYKYNTLLLIIPFVVSLLFLKNVQLFLGYTVQTFHWSRDAAVPFMLLLLIFFTAKKYSGEKTILLVFVTFFSFFQLSAATYVDRHWKNHIADTNEEELYGYLNENTLNRDIIAVPWSMSSSVLNHAKRKVYVPHAPVTFSDSDETISRLIDYYCAIGLEHSDFKKLLDGKYAYYSVHHMDRAYHPATLSYYLSRDDIDIRPPYFSPPEKADIVNRFDTCIKDMKVDNFQMKYQVNYIVVLDVLPSSKFLKKYKSVKIPGYRIYHLKDKLSAGE